MADDIEVTCPTERVLPVMDWLHGQGFARDQKSLQFNPDFTWSITLGDGRITATHTGFGQIFRFGNELAYIATQLAAII